jgi:hypothetical protein
LALQLSDVIGIHGKTVKIERSHLPAVSLVPPGMHRVDPQGYGKSTKQNQQRRRREHHHHHHHELPNVAHAGEDDDSRRKPSEENDEPAKASSAAAAAGPPQQTAVSSSTSILAFRPREMTRKSKSIKPNAKIDALPSRTMDTNDAK